jgi:hypothetical protein
MFNLAVWPGFKVAGNVAPETEKPVPVSVAPLMVTGAVPVEVKVKDCAVGVLTTMLPNAKVVAPALSVGIAAFSCTEKVFDTLPALAVMVAA